MASLRIFWEYVWVKVHFFNGFAPSCTFNASDSPSVFGLRRSCFSPCPIRQQSQKPKLDGHGQNVGTITVLFLWIFYGTRYCFEIFWSMLDIGSFYMLNHIVFHAFLISSSSLCCSLKIVTPETASRAAQDVFWFWWPFLGPLASGSRERIFFCVARLPSIRLQRCLRGPPR